MRFRLFTVLGALAGLIAGIGSAAAQTNTITKPYLMAFDGCPAGACQQAQNQSVDLAQSDDGVTWQLVRSVSSASVPTAIRRGNEIYLIYLSFPPNAPQVRALQRYHLDSGIWDAPVTVTLQDTQSNGNFVDPSLILDPQGNIVLVYLSSPTPAAGDPAQCNPSPPCNKSIRMATEVAGSDGSNFVADANDIATLTITTSPGNASDPNLFFDGTQYVLYVSFNTSTVVYTNSTLHGAYQLSSSLPSGILVPHMGGVAGGFYNTARQQYWTYSMNMASPQVIVRATHASLATQVQPANFTTVLTGGDAGIGLGSGTSVVHPHLSPNWSGSQTMVAAVLPLSRSVQVGNTATAFATMINTDTVNAADCYVRPLTSVPASFTFQTTNPSTNALSGSANTPVAISGGNGVQTYVIAFTPTAAFPPTDVQIAFGCASSTAATPISGVSTLLLSGSATPVPDIVALAASGDPGIVDIPGANGAGAFAVATVNVGATSSITATADTGSASLPVTLTLCQTNPASGACLQPPSASVATTIAANATPTFGIFAAGSGNVPFDPANNRVFVRFKDSGGATRGSTSVAVRTQ